MQKSVFVQLFLKGSYWSCCCFCIGIRILMVTNCTSENLYSLFSAYVFLCTEERTTVFMVVRRLTLYFLHGDLYSSLESFTIYRTQIF